MQYTTALFIGRFQPFHNGHLYSLKKCLEIAEKVVVLVAKAEAAGEVNDPWGVRERKRMVCEVVRANKLDHRIARIVSCPDYPSDAEWVKQVELRIKNTGLSREQVVVVSNNEWVTRLMKERGYPIHETGLYNREELEGVKVRELMRQGSDEWKKRVPREIVDLFDKNDIEMVR